MSVYCRKNILFMQIDWSKLFSYINNCADRKTVEEVEHWRKKDSRNEDFYQRVRDYYKNVPTRNESFSEEQLNVLYTRMLKGKRRKRQRVLWQRMTVAASVMLLISVGMWWYYTGNVYKENAMQVAAVSSTHTAEVIVVTESGDKFTTDN